ncbi:succinate-semialdehyde dehydrogenase (NADP(+)) [Hoyosella rhizosphaerae]|uniref:succinate-semialdehyde dehydrogenase (NADP(+)) n=1 Tax=Hoyosella rhizosphaerae TaxID=1755582 RepID=A0A916UAW5_9ACTN|nr:succinic semialdehyde dehydrogenase [Hoyosella rhizosphaerae]MBN4927443.1 succinate-semialdehyde dehydrogenase (NADP(+)) [Hoyosella rhizosphaerae]GGC64351.1 putative succinate-semialdehyde dehydrogenase [NADP(+)] [Hoyosella rhizosphaerae]
MAAPSAETFARLAKLVAIDDPDARPTRTVYETFTGRELATIPVATAEDAIAAVERARVAQKEWAKVPVAERAKIFHKYHDLVLSRRDTLLDLAQAETGKSRESALEEVLDIAMTARYYARTAPKLLEKKSVQGLFPALTKTSVNYRPKGVVGMITPWNYPMTLAVSDAIPAIIAGNAVVMKPDSQTPYCALGVAELLYEAGLPKELFAVVPGPGSIVGTALVENTEYIMFTGSTATGRLLAEQCGRRLIGFSAELGGKNPMIVTKDANLNHVVDAATRACFSNSGQLCISIERIYVEDAVADEFIEKFGEKVRSMTLSSDYELGSDMGSLISESQVKNVKAHVDDAVAKGATVIAGGKPRPDVGPLFFEPTVLTDVTEKMDVYRSETFGPLVSIYRVKDVDEAIAEANDTEYGLNASIWAGSESEGEKIAERINSGTANVNEGYGPAWGSLGAPMGGMGVSGVGRRHGPEGLLKYTEAQTVAVQRLIDLGGPSWLDSKYFSQALPWGVKAMKFIPGR